MGGLSDIGSPKLPGPDSPLDYPSFLGSPLSSPRSPSEQKAQDAASKMFIEEPLPQLKSASWKKNWSISHGRSKQGKTVKKAAEILKSDRGETGALRELMNARDGRIQLESYAKKKYMRESYQFLNATREFNLTKKAEVGKTFAAIIDKFVGNPDLPSTVNLSSELRQSLVQIREKMGGGKELSGEDVASIKNLLEEADMEVISMMRDTQRNAPKEKTFFESAEWTQLKQKYKL